MNLEYVLLFLIGGTFMTLNKYITNEVSPKLGAILITFPVGLLSTYFIISEDKVSKYLKNYIKQILFIIMISFLYLLMFQKKLLGHKNIFITITGIWAIFAISEMVNH